MRQIRSHSLAAWALFAITAAFPAEAGTPQIQSIAVEITIDRTAKEVQGVERIMFEPLRGQDTVSLSLQGQRVGSVTLDEVALRFDATDGRLVIHLPPEHRDGDPISIGYSATEPAGLVFLDEAVYTGFDTCTWMICDPSPGIRAPFELALTVADGEDVVASGRLISIERTAAGKRFVWRQAAPYPAYLYGFVAGRLNQYTTDLDGRIVRHVSPALTIAEMRKIAQATRGMIPFFENASGLELPGRRYTQVIVEGSAAQEKSTLSMLGTDQLEGLDTDPTEDWLIAHELAHQFWGNLVTPQTWDEMWLSEGLVTFMTAAWKEHRWGRDKYDREMELAARREQFAVSEGFDVPLAWRGEYPSLRVKRAIAYSRGALFLDDLRKMLGEATFWKALRQFTREYSGSSVISSDFQRTLERVSGRDLSKLFESRVYGDESAR